MHKKKRILLTGGGSGGHIIPNLVVASALKKQDSTLKLLYVASRSPLDLALLKDADMPVKQIFTGKLRRYFHWRNFVDPFLVLFGFFQSFFILLRFWPHVVFSKGGYVSLPVVLAAFVLRRPVVLHESDSVMGLANRITSCFAKRICISFPGVLPTTKKVVFTGNPVRPEIVQGEAKIGYQLTGFRADKPVVLVWGGSLGARQINEMIADEFRDLKSKFQIIHISGKAKETTLQDASYVQFDYLEDELKHIYAITDLVVGRAGANSLYELALMKKPNILIPLKSADQPKNAAYFEDRGASLVLAKGQSLYALLSAVWHNRKQYESMQSALSTLARPVAAEVIGKLVLAV